MYKNKKLNSIFNKPLCICVVSFNILLKIYIFICTYCVVNVFNIRNIKKVRMVNEFIKD